MVDSFPSRRRTVTAVRTESRGEALHPTQSAKTVRLREGEQLVTDGPFAETKEQLGGYYLVDVETEEEAVRWAAKIPSAPYGSIEVRPVMVFTAEVGS